MRPRLRRLALALLLASATLAPPARAQHCDISATGGSAGFCGNVDHSTINLGVPEAKVDDLVKQRTKPLEDLTAVQKETIGLLKEKLDLNERQVRSALDIVGEAEVPPERLAAKLIEIAQRYKALKETAAAQSGDDPTIAARKAEAQQAIDHGDLARADAALAEVEAEQKKALDRLESNAAETAARRGEIALTRLRYREAAQHFSEAAATLPLGEEQEKAKTDYLTQAAYALYRQGDEFGDNAALVEAVGQLDRLARSISRERDPLLWAITQNNLGNALVSLGAREVGSARLEEAVAAFRAAIEEYARERVPLKWAGTQNNLGTALETLGERESGTERLEGAAAAFRAALQEYTHERAPREWAMTQSNLGNALLRLGERESGTARLEEAVAAFRAALGEYVRESVPLAWAMTQNNLGNALVRLGERGSGTARLDEARASYRAALEEFTRERVPLDWAMTQNNLGMALWRLGERESGTARLEEAVGALRAALEERTQKRVPLAWATTQNNLGIALATLGERESGTRRLEEAALAFRAALEERTQERTPYYWAQTQKNLDRCLALLEQRRNSGRAPGNAGVPPVP